MVAQMVKRLPTMRETWVRFLSRKDPLEKEMATHSSTLAWKSHGLKSLVGYSPWGHKELDTIERLHLTLHAFNSQELLSAEFYFLNSALFLICGGNIFSNLSEYGLP